MGSLTFRHFYQSRKYCFFSDYSKFMDSSINCYKTSPLNKINQWRVNLSNREINVYLNVNAGGMNI